MLELLQLLLALIFCGFELEVDGFFLLLLALQLQFLLLVSTIKFALVLGYLLELLTIRQFGLHPQLVFYLVLLLHRLIVLTLLLLLDSHAIDLLLDQKSHLLVDLFLLFEVLLTRLLLLLSFVVHLGS